MVVIWVKRPDLSCGCGEGEEGSYSKEVKSPGLGVVVQHLEIASQITFAISLSVDAFSIVTSGFLTCVRNLISILCCSSDILVLLHIHLYEPYSSVRVQC